MKARLSLALSAAAFVAGMVSAIAAERATLRAEIRVDHDIVTLGDLVEGVDGQAAAAPLFRAPRLGDTGTIQVHRIVEAAQNLGIADIDTRGRAQVVVARAARRIGAAESEAALRQALEARHGLDARSTTIVFDGGAPIILAAPDGDAPLSVQDLLFDPRTRRISATLVVPGGVQPATKRVTGNVVETVEVAVANRSFQRGDVLQASDISFERRTRDGLPSDVLTEVGAIAGQVVKRSLAVGTVMRAGDVHRPEIVTRGDVVTVIYESRGLSLSLRGRAVEGGALGDTVTVQNIQSKRTLQGQVVAPGRISVNLVPTGRVAAVAATTARP
ncbi:flagellar basal body P-ring formation chaperone FlgA [Chelatococcus sp. SYSU_G07232]|uniref:Flagellar basal body P-ring formation chaperone FlgA n=1 Tax=Chelatococcus albus TaxID=3047466 RepID=A0ABT7AHJ2_9HYPH|nr:flagellar basal body P-ring formation chaperone FlgA [Chelatococcus sp. SYSU_G07232]MDJ1158452.1 flagellar basal body P-ring formation chaperone FlgA [Chelatococcus sp. SYSU_G07232]